MIRPLRTRHRGLVLIVALVAGALLVAALLVRRPIPTVEALDVGTVAGETGNPR